MQPHIAIFNALLAAMCIYAVVRGGQPEKLAALGWTVGCIATFLLPFDPTTTYHSIDVPGLVIDLIVLAGFVALAVTANRFWPLWLAAVHLVTIAVHLVKAYEADLLPSIYAFAVSKAAYPMLLLIVFGIARHHARVCRNGFDRDWSFSPRVPA